MKKDTHLEKVKAPLFLIGLATLLLNDFYFKYQFSNELTGKLSDIAGLFVFPYFISIFNPRTSKFAYCFTATIFIFWKLPVSQAFIDFCNGFGIGLYRTIDYSDLVALLVLPFSYYYFNSIILKSINQQKPIVTFVAVISVFAFCATTLPRREMTLRVKTNKAFVLELSKEKLFTFLHPAHDYSDSRDTLQNSSSDSLFYVYFRIPELKANVTSLVNIKDLNSGRVVIQLDSIISSYVTGGLFTGIDQDDIDNLEELTPSDFENYFEKYFINLINNNSASTTLYYEKKKTLNSYQQVE